MELIFKGREEFLMGICQSQFYVSTRLGHRVPRYLVKYYFWMCVWGGFCMRLTFESVYWVKQISLLSVGGHHPIYWRPDRNQKAEEGRISFLCLTVLELEHQSSPAFGFGRGLKLMPSAFLLLRPLDSDWNYIICGFHGSGLLSLSI